MKPHASKGRGALENTPNRFERLFRDSELIEEAIPADNPRTEFLTDHSKSVLTQNDSPDIGFSASVNPYRGCEHGCIYCYARPTHEYLGYSAGIDFETKILVKEDAPALLRKKLISKAWIPQTVAMSGVTDPYQPVERKLALTRRCLEVLRDFRNPVLIITKNHLVTRDIDVLAELAASHAAAVFLSITSLDPQLIAVMEPRTSRPAFRLDAIQKLSAAGIPTGVLVAPVIPGLTDSEMPAILEAASAAGAKHAGFTPIRLPLAVAPLFTQWLETHFPDRKDKVLNRIREIRGGKLNDPNFNSRMQGEGVYAEQLRGMFKVFCKKHGLNEAPLRLSTAAFLRDTDQLDLFR